VEVTDRGITLAYYETAKITAVKSFLVEALEREGRTFDQVCKYNGVQESSS